ncbi:Holliday junction branch migration protein RuvA [Patescibacteria group bacterium]
MIAYIEGKIIKKTEKGIILKTDQIGHFINLNKDAIAKVQEKEKVHFYIYQHIREDTNDLYGFSKFEKMEFFKQLLSINGIGPKVALEISNIPSNKIKSAIINEDSNFICTIPGIGKKTAQRIILELKNKIDIDSLENLESSSIKQIDDDVIGALTNLGYQRKHILNTLREMPEKIQTEQDIITYFLKNA